MTEKIDLRDYDYMPLYMERLQKSKAWLACKRDPALAFYMLNLWMRSWHEVPCGSLENDDDVLSDAAMCDPKTWARIKQKVLRGWEESDGRLFHSVVEEVAAEVNTKKRTQRNRTAAATEARRLRNIERNEERNVKGNVNRDDDQNEQRDVAVTSTKGREGKGEEGKGREEKVPIADAIGASAPTNGDSPPEWWPTKDRYGRIRDDVDDKTMWQVAGAVLGQKHKSLLGKYLKTPGSSWRKAVDLLLLAHEKAEPVPYFAKIVRSAEMDEFDGVPHAAHEKFPENTYTER